MVSRTFYVFTLFLNTHTHSKRRKTHTYRYTGGWCRPQNDGPPLRAKTLVEYANALTSDLSDSLLGGRPTVSDIWELVKVDLDWTASNYNADGCDLWEEIRSTDFFWNRYTTRASLLKGSAFAKKQGDDTRSNTYRIAAQEIENELKSHIETDSDGMTYLFEADNRKKDSAVICGLNNGNLNDGLYAASGKYAAGTCSVRALPSIIYSYSLTSRSNTGTVKVLTDLFCTTFQVNQDDTSAGVPGVLYGRYEGDSYAGGNPWILLSSALAELLYRGASEMRTASFVTDEDVSTWISVLGLDSSSSKSDVADAMAGAGDGVLFRVRKHVASSGFHLSEQLDRETGVLKSANDLTWSYAATLKAMDARDGAF